MHVSCHQAAWLTAIAHCFAGPAGSTQENVKVLEVLGSIPISALAPLKSLEILIMQQTPEAGEEHNRGIFICSPQPSRVQLGKLRYVDALSLGTLTSNNFPELQYLALVSPWSSPSSVAALACS